MKCPRDGAELARVDILGLQLDQVKDPPSVRAFFRAVGTLLGRMP